MNISRACCCYSLSHVQLFATPWIAAHQASLSLTIYLLGFAQIHIHWAGDAIQPCHPLSPPSPPAFNPSQHQGFSNESALHIRWPKYWSFSFSIGPSSEYSGLMFFRIDWFDLLSEDFQESSLAPQFESINSLMGLDSIPHKKYKK